MKGPAAVNHLSTKSRLRVTQQRLGEWRRTKDRLTNVVITAGGMGVLVAILSIFFYLLYEVLPLFQSASISAVSSYQLSDPTSAKPLYLAMEEQAELAVQLDDDGQLLFFKAENGEEVERVHLPFSKKISHFALNSEQQPLMALAANDEILLVKPSYSVSYPGDQRVITPFVEYPYGDRPKRLTAGVIDSLAVRDSDEQLVIVTESKRALQGVRLLKEQDFLTEEIVLQEEQIILPSIDIDVDWMLIGPNQRWLYLLNRESEYRVINLVTEQQVDSGRMLDVGKITDARFLLGGISLMIGTDQGAVDQWFMVQADNQPPYLQRVRSFGDSGSGSDIDNDSTKGIETVVVEHRRKSFITVSSDMDLAIYHTTSERQLLNVPISAGSISIEQIAISPRAKALLTQNSEGEVTYWSVHNEHPEVSWKALWNEVWYESYPEPDYIWQSSASNNDFEAKFSFTPLAFGTLKAAFYAMLVAAPLALCAAIYTAYFMTPGLRRKVKPLIELMEAMPTVILGFLAGLWLAPFIERNLPGVISIFLLMPVAVLLFGYVWSRLPGSITLKVPDGWHAVLLVPVVIVIIWGCVAVSGFLELWFFSGNIKAWLTYDLGIPFDQRNAMVVGIAMGFAVVPTIFSIAEDAIFSVPKSLSYGSLALGASPWQTLIGVVIPTASPGIFSAMMIGMGRAVGETMIVLMATGNTPIMDVNIFEGMRTFAANIAIEIGETEVDSSHFRVLFMAAFVLFIFTFVVNSVAEIVRQRLRKKYGSL
jgi:phosphate transport system permease protein